MKDMDLGKWLVKLKALEPKYLFALLGAVAVIVLALDVLLITRPQLGAIAALDRKTTQLKADIDTLSTNKQRMAKFHDNLEAARLEMKDFKAMVHRADGISAVLKTVSTLANQYGVKIDQLAPQKSDGVVLVANEDGKYTSLAIVVRARSGYHDLGRFLNRLEQEKVFWQLEGVTVAADSSDIAWHNVRMQMKLLILGGV